MIEKNREQPNQLELFESEHWKITVGLQKITGLYRFQSDRRNCISWLYIGLFNLSFMIALGVRLVIEIGVHREIVIENTMAVMFMIVIFLKLMISIMKRKSFKRIHLKIAAHWRTLSDAEELEVMTQNLKNGDHVAKIYSLYMIVGMAIFLAMPVGYPLLDYVIPMENLTRPRAFPAYVEYGVDPDEYYYTLMTQGFFGGLGCIAVFVAFDLSFMMLTNYVIGLFALVKHRLLKVNTLMKTMEEQNINSLNSNWSMPYIVGAVEIHQLALAYANDLEEMYNKFWFLQLVLDVATIGGCFVIIKVKQTPEEILRYTAMLVGAFIHFYYIFLPGQEIINASEEVFDACYESNWYALSRKSKHLLKFIMIRSLSASYLTGGKMFPLCMDTYCGMLKTSLSWVTIVQSFMDF